MNNQKEIIKLSSIQKILLDEINKSKILDGVENNEKISFGSINIDNLKKFNEIHNKIGTILENNNIEPHEIINLIDRYNGKHEIFNKFKTLIVSRNMCIIKKVYKTEKWNNNISKLVDIFKEKYMLPKKCKKTMNEILDDIIIDILIKDINVFDIYQNRIIVDNKNHFKQLNVSSFDDQKNIILKLLEKGCIKY
jgi:hypothetical protein